MGLTPIEGTPKNTTKQVGNGGLKGVRNPLNSRQAVGFYLALTRIWGVEDPCLHEKYQAQIAASIVPFFFMCSWGAFLSRLSGYPETVFSTSSLWKSFLSILTNADWWFSKEKYVPHNDIMNSQRKIFWAVTKPCFGFLARHNLTCHVKFWKPSVAQVLLMRFFERNFVFWRYRLRSGIRFFHKPREMDSFDL